MRSGNRALTVRQRVGKLLPLIVEFLNRRHPVSGYIAVIFQIRKVTIEGRQRSLSVVTLQEFPRTHLPQQSRLLAPALFSDDVFQSANDLADVRKVLGIKRGSKGEEALRKKLEGCDWNYDLIVQVTEVDERMPSSGDPSSSRSAGEVAVTIRGGKIRVADDSAEPGFCDTDIVGWSDSVFSRCVCVPWLPPRVRFRSDENCVVYLIAGRASLDVLKEVNEVWRRGTTRNLLLAASPGSGKEVVARLIHFGRGSGQFVVASVGGAQWSEFQVPLLGQGQPTSGPPLFRGYIEQAAGGTLFIDEVDKAAGALRSALLRIIENDEFIRPQSWERVRLSRHTRPLFMFAGSGQGEIGAKALTDPQVRKENNLPDKPSTEQLIRAEQPSDFWDRIDRVISFEKPYTKSTDSYYRDYVELFLRRAVDSSFAREPSVYTSERLLAQLDEQVRRRIQKNWLRLLNALLDALGTGNLSLRVIRASATELVSRVSEPGVTMGAAYLRDLARQCVRKVTGTASP